MHVRCGCSTRNSSSSWYFSRTIDESCLERRNWWNVVSGQLRADDSDDEDEDALEVGLTDELGFTYDEVYISEDSIF